MEPKLTEKEQAIAHAITSTLKKNVLDSGTIQDVRRGPNGGITTFVYHIITPEGKAFYLAGIPLDKDGRVRMERAIVAPVTPHILRLTPEERAAVSVKLEEYMDKGPVPPIWQRVSDPEIRESLRTTCIPRVDKVIFGRRPHYLDQYDSYYRGLMAELLHQKEGFGVERVASSMEQAVFLCHPTIPASIPSARNPLYVVESLRQVMKEYEMPERSFVILQAYQDAFHQGNHHTFCHCATKEERERGLSLRFLPQERPNYTFQIIARNENPEKPIQQAHVVLRPQEPDELEKDAKAIQIEALQAIQEIFQKHQADKQTIALAMRQLQKSLPSLV